MSTKTNMGHHGDSVSRPVGRPGRLSRGRIAAAAYEVGLANVTLRTVAEHLDVSVTGLYHYIEGRDDLLQLAAEYSVTQLRGPADRGQHWAVWVVEWALHTRDGFLEQPELLQQLIAGAVEMDRTAERVDTVIGFLVRHGFSVQDANLMYRLSCECAIGAAVELIRERNAAAAGRPVVAEYHRVLAMRPGELPYLRSIIEERARPVDSLEETLLLLLPAFTPTGENRAVVQDRIAAVFDELGPHARQRIAPVEDDPATSRRRRDRRAKPDQPNHERNGL